ncbi:DUF3492 domain-containing protein [Streptomyces sp. NPDC003374]
MRIGLVTEGGYPYVGGDAGLWCERLVHGLEQHEFDLYALSRSRQQEREGRLPLPPQVARVRTAPLWTDGTDGTVLGRRARRRLTGCLSELAEVLSATSNAPLGATDADAPAGDGPPEEADRFASALYELADLAREEGGLTGALRSETAVRALERACRAPGAVRAARTARVPDLLTVAAHLERALRPLSLDWYEDDGLGAADVCHAASGGTAALPGLLARHFCGVPLLVTEYGVPLRAHYLAPGADGTAPAARALLAAFHGRLAAEVYRRAAVVTHGNAHTRRWQERCGADRARLRTVHPGMDALPFAEVGEGPQAPGPGTLVWVGRVEPTKDLVSLLHAFAEVRRQEPAARLRILGGAGSPDGAAYLGHCRALAAQLFPDEAEGLHAVGDNPVSFEELGGPEAPTAADAYAAGAVVVLSSVVEGLPVGLVEAMFCGRATVSTDVGAVVEVIGGTGLVVPPRNPRALAEACVTLLRDPERRARLGAAARARALELFTVEQNVAAFHGIYLEIVSHCPVRRVVLDGGGDPLPFAVPAEVHVPGHWTGPGAPAGVTTRDTAHVGARDTVRGGPAWVTPGPDRATDPAGPDRSQDLAGLDRSTDPAVPGPAARPSRIPAATTAASAPTATAPTTTAPTTPAPAPTTEATR